MEQPNQKPNTRKKYRCMNCGKESTQNTNHCGYIYPPCTQCGHMEHEYIGDTELLKHTDCASLRGFYNIDTTKL